MPDPLPDPDSAVAGATAASPTGSPAVALEGVPVTAPDHLTPQAESRTTRLYRAALGPVNTAHYLQVFDRFDTAGRRHLLWHPAAGLFTLAWLVFRRLWAEALVYGLLVAAGAGLCFWAWPVWQSWPPGVRWGVLGSVCLVGVLLPGLLGHGLLHRRVQRRLLQAVSAARSMDEARATLARQAATRQRLWAVVTAQAVVLAVLGLLVFRPGDPPGAVVASFPSRTTADAMPPVADAGSAGQPVLSQAVPAVLPSADEVLAVPAPGPVQTAAPVEPAAASAPAAPVPSTDLSGVPTPAEPAAVHDINVGLFADEGNARRAEQRLLEAGLPVRVQRISTRQGPRMRVRVGPFPQRETADAAAQRIRALGLEAVVFRP